MQNCCIIQLNLTFEIKFFTLIKKLLIFSVLLFAVISIKSQQYNFHNYSVKDGVAQSQIYALLQDSRGYLWMGTRGGGISRFDGSSFKSYSVNDGLINSYVFCLKEDAQHKLWIGTQNGFSVYDGLTFKNYLPKSYIDPVWVCDFAFENESKVWLATNVGVLLFENGKFTNVYDLVGKKRNIVNTVFFDHNKNLWVGDGNGLSLLSQKSGSYSFLLYDKSRGFRANSITSINEDKEGKLWIGTYGDGLYVYDGKNFNRIDYNLELYKQSVLDIYFDNHNNVWLSTLSHGVAEYNIETKSFTWLTENEGLSNNHVRCAIQDRWGNYWFGTSGGGVCNYFGKQFTTYDKSSGLAGNFIYSVFRDSKNRLWVGTSDKGLSRLDSAGFVNFSAENGFAAVKVKCIIESGNGTVFFGTDGQGVYMFNGTEFSILPAINKKYVRDFSRDKNGDIWVATAGTGLYKISEKDGKVLVENFREQDGLLNNRINCLHYDKQGRLWYGTENNGIGLMIENQIKNFSLTVKNGLPNNAIRCMTEDANGNLWVGTPGYGIAEMPLYQGNNYKIRSFGFKNGLTSSNVYLLVSDEKNNLFVGSETGLDYLIFDKNRKLATVKHYSKGEGFTGVETCQNSVFRENDGSIWFGTINGLTKYNPNNKIRNANPPVTNITDLKLFYVSIVETKFRNFVHDWNSFQSINLPYNQNHLTFEFNALNFSNPDAVKYQWKLEGFDEKWSPVSKNHSIMYSNLSPGDYIFRVKACNEDGVWNEKAVELSFHIEAPFWMKWWFILSAVIFVFGLIYLIFRWNLNRVKAKAAEEQQKLQLEKEVVELEQKALRLQMNPHFIFNALNSIQSQIGVDNEQIARYYLAKFSHLMRQILSNSRSSSITLEDEISTMENYLLIEKFCNGDRFDYSIKADDEIEKDYIKVPPMLLQPFIENAIKHGLKHLSSEKESKRGKIEIEFHEIGNMLECSVTDNGIGREKAKELNKYSKETYHQSTALIVTQERLELLNRGREIIPLEIIDLHNENGEACGTKVIVRIPVD